MGEFLAREFILTLQDLDRLRLLSERLEEQTQRIKAGLEITVTAESIERTKRDVEERLTELAGHCEALGLRSTLTYIGWMRKHLSKPPEDLGGEMGFDLQIPHGLDKARGMIPELREWVMSDLSEPILVAVDPSRSTYHRNTELFGPEVSKKCGSASRDIEEAGKSLALGRYTASVFHLMRVVESGLTALGKSLDDPSLDPKTNPNWERILGRCDAELKKPIAQRSELWRRDGQFYVDATAFLRAVKDAWRNPTMHVEIFYDERAALEVWNAVASLMRHLATRLSE